MSDKLLAVTFSKTGYDPTFKSTGTFNRNLSISPLGTEMFHVKHFDAQQR